MCFLGFNLQGAQTSSLAGAVAEIVSKMGIEANLEITKGEEVFLYQKPLTEAISQIPNCIQVLTSELQYPSFYSLTFRMMNPYESSHCQPSKVVITNMLCDPADSLHLWTFIHRTWMQKIKTTTPKLLSSKQTKTFQQLPGLAKKDLGQENNPNLAN